MTEQVLRWFVCNALSTPAMWKHSCVFETLRFYMLELNLFAILFITNMAVEPFTYRQRRVHEFLALSKEKTIHTPKWTAMPSIFVKEATL